MIPRPTEGPQLATSEKQAEANRRNAQSSTGPRTEEGKAFSSMNALKHGLTAMQWVLPTQDPEEHARFREATLRDLAPVGALEEQLAEEIVGLSWRLRRASTLELGILARGVADADERFYTEQRRRFVVTEGDIRASELAQAGLDQDHVVAITNSDLHEFFGELIDEAVSVKRTEEARLAEAFVDDAAGPDALAKLTRYETSLFRRRNQALETLAKLQNARASAQQSDPS